MARMYTYTTDNFVDGAPVWAQMALEDELADVSSWLFALVIKTDSMRRVADTYYDWLSDGTIEVAPEI